jgi:hypothetical protein
LGVVEVVVRGVDDVHMVGSKTTTLSCQKRLPISETSEPIAPFRKGTAYTRTVSFLLDTIWLKNLITGLANNF